MSDPHGIIRNYRKGGSMNISEDVMEDLKDQVGQILYFDEGEEQLLNRLTAIYNAGRESK